MQTAWLVCHECGQSRVHRLIEVGEFLLKFCMFCNKKVLLRENDHATLAAIVERQPMPQNGKKEWGC